MNVRIKLFSFILTLYFSLVPFCIDAQKKELIYTKRFQEKLNFKGSLTGFVGIHDKGISLYKNATDKSADKPELTVYYTEVSFFNLLLKSYPIDTVEALLKRKKNKPWTAAELNRFSDDLEKNYIQQVYDSSKGPLQNKKIVIDPGHIAGNFDMAFMEQKYLRFLKDSFPELSADSVRICEGILTFQTASVLKKQLESQGAEVIMTRGNNKTVFGITYEEWLKTRKNKVLDSLKVAGEMNESKCAFLKKLDDRKFFWEFFKDYELAGRIKFINNQKPDLVIIIHYNVDEKNKDWVRPSSKNYTMAFIPGAMTSDVFNKYRGKISFLRLLLSDDLMHSEKLAELTVKEFQKNLGIPAAQKNDADYLKDNSISTKHAGVFCRNLALCRAVNAPLVYGECLYQDHLNEYSELEKTNVEYFGIKTNKRIVQVAQSYFNAIINYYQIKN